MKTKPIFLITVAGISLLVIECTKERKDLPPPSTTTAATASTSINSTTASTRDTTTTTSTISSTSTTSSTQSTNTDIPPKDSTP